MTKDEIIELAKQAGFADGLVEIVGLYGFMKFAVLAAELAAEREREECAKVCDTHYIDDVLGGVGVAQSCAAVIRARSEK